MEVHNKMIRWKKYFQQGEQNIYCKSMNLRKKALGKWKFLRGKSTIGKRDHIIEGFIYSIMKI